MKKNHIYTGNCVQVLNKKIDAQSIDLIFADPPYNLSGNGLAWRGNLTGGDWYMVNEKWDKMPAPEYLKFTRQWVGACRRVLKPHGSIYIACSLHNIGEVMMTLKQAKFKINNIITWCKSNAMPNMTKRMFTHSTEFVIWAARGRGWTFNYEKTKEINPNRQKNGDLKQMRDFWEIPLVQGQERLRGKDGRALHPTQKPEVMLERIILASSNEGDLVLDPFVGSGTTTYIAKKHGRKWIGIDSNAKYVKMSNQRMRAKRPSKPKRKSANDRYAQRNSGALHLPHA